MIIRALKTKLEELKKDHPGKINVMLETVVEKLIEEDNRVVGVATSSGEEIKGIFLKVSVS